MFTQYVITKIEIEDDGQTHVSSETLVFCKDCARRNTDDCPFYVLIPNSQYDNDFCSLGELADPENDDLAWHIKAEGIT